jgi:hypothetical protein
LRTALEHDEGTPSSRYPHRQHVQSNRATNPSSALTNARVTTDNSNLTSCQTTN